VEILSPSTARIDLGRKRALYAEHGVPWYWIVDPDARTIDALKLVGSIWEAFGRLAGSTPTALPPLPDLVLDPAAIWR
jgi:Uma2 family endonuclease